MLVWQNHRIIMPSISKILNLEDTSFSHSQIFFKDHKKRVRLFKNKYTFYVNFYNKMKSKFYVKKNKLDLLELSFYYIVIYTRRYLLLCKCYPKKFMYAFLSSFMMNLLPDLKFSTYKVHPTRTPIFYNSSESPHLK